MQNSTSETKPKTVEIYQQTFLIYPESQEMLEAWDRDVENL